MRVRAAASVLPLIASALVAATPAAARPKVASSQSLVVLYGVHSVRGTPNALADTIASVGALRPITDARTTLPVIARKLDESGRTWLRVRLPGRTLGALPPPRSGWIGDWDTQLLKTAWHIVIDTRARAVSVYRSGHRVRRYSAIVGSPATPTPRGEYFVEENLRLAAGEAGAPFALATSARSSVLQEFAGGPGQIALHGVRNIGGRLGTAVSHGCIRLGDAAIKWLAARIRPGVPLTIV